MVKLVAFVAVIAGVIGACALLEDDLPEARTCARTEDCFKGETCSLTDKVCVAIDAGTQ